MLPAIVLILWANLVALLGVGAALGQSISDDKRRQAATTILGIAAVISFVPATWQTIEVWNQATDSTPGFLRYR